MKYENLEPGLYRVSQGVHEEILKDEDIMASIDNLIPLLENWSGNFLHYDYHRFKDIKTFNSIFFTFLNTQTAQLDWILFSIYSGFEDTALRELRNILETAFVFFKYDYNEDYRNLTMEEKYHKLDSEFQEFENKNSYPFGKRIFTSSGYAEHQSIYENLYRPLSKYTHTFPNLEKTLVTFEDSFDGIHEPCFDKEKILESINFFKKVIQTEIKMFRVIQSEIYEIPIDDTEDYALKLFS